MLKEPVEIRPDEGAHLKRLFVISVVIAGGKGESAQHDAAFDLCAEALRPAVYIQFGDVAEIFRPVAVPDPVKTGEVGGGFGAGKHIISRQSGAQSGQRDFAHAGAQFPEALGGGKHGGFDIGGDSFFKTVARQADPQTRNAPADARKSGRHGVRETGGVAAVFSGDDRKHQRVVAHRARERADLIQ